MKKFLMFVLSFILFSIPPSSGHGGGLYKYKDKKGNLCITNDPSRIYHHKNNLEEPRSINISKSSRPDPYEGLKPDPPGILLANTKTQESGLSATDKEAVLKKQIRWIFDERERLKNLEAFLNAQGKDVHPEDIVVYNRYVKVLNGQIAEYIRENSKFNK